MPEQINQESQSELLTPKPVGKYEDLRSKNWNKSDKRKTQQTLWEQLSGSSYSSEQARMAEKRRNERAILAEALEAEETTDSVTDYNPKALAEMCEESSVSRMQATRMVIAAVQANPEAVEANKRLCNYLRDHYAE